MRFYRNKKTGELIASQDLESVEILTSAARKKEIEKWKEDRIEKFIKSIDKVAKDLIKKIG